MTKYAIFHRNESLIESIVSDCVTFGFFALCIWYSTSRNSDWWVFFMSALCLISLSAKFQLRGNGSRWVKHKTKKELLEWANAQPDDCPNAEAHGKNRREVNSDEK